MSDHFGILGFPWDGGASLGRPGARLAPKEIREAFGWFKGRIQAEKVYHVETRKIYNVSDEKIVDYGDVDIVAYSVEQTIENAEEATKSILQKAGFPFILGGDHSISYPIIKALHDSCKGQVGIIHFDAHLDLVDENHLQGKYSQSSEIRRALELERVAPEHVVQIGVRGFNYPWYAEYLKETGIKQYTAFDVHAGDPLTIAKESLDRLKGCEKIYLTFDIDVLDPAFAPGTGADEPFGLVPYQCMIMLNEFYDKVDAFDIAETNPTFDVHGITTAVASRIMFECFIHKFGK
ncbi:agmatinase family protein [Aminipila sp.]|uniref:agmatinase family protein n=1 Tax=Aminipila sp. TaxID=2060095 RepID=UPI0028A0CB55|nr:agmatinase family protein [Aminipila sp.]